MTTEQKRILVVDDEPVNRRVLINLLPLKGYRVSQCSTGKQALDRISQANDTIDLVLLDVMMTGLSGYQVCQEIRKTHPINRLPVIFLTAKSQLNDLQSAYASGGNDFLSKPIAKEELFARIESHLRLAKLNRNVAP